jgi:hypothetical protein
LHPLTSCSNGALSAGPLGVENEDSADDDRWRALAEIDENLIRRDLTPAQRAKGAEGAQEGISGRISRNQARRRPAVDSGQGSKCKVWTAPSRLTLGPVIRRSRAPGAQLVRVDQLKGASEKMGRRTRHPKGVILTIESLSRRQLVDH